MNSWVQALRLKTWYKDPCLVQGKRQRGKSGLVKVLGAASLGCGEGE